ncbi:PH domain-containing protein [Maribacter sp. HTCC2170]|uniref:PH domain-containing protein n=1 Tax=Maribacter sp. (strain HTCC2170 / KCCM 42371) TaxID=313603 RepID=UPI00006BD215|nr:PH domain-containing protein [Maribacter sp. HTCC2170]EAR02494.1 lipoprotein, putative [Maribacter sp. HTCC2170]
MKVYKSKIGVGISIFIGLVLGLGAYQMFKDGLWLGLAINVLVALFVIYLFLQTYYVIDGKTLKVKSGFIVNKSFEINRIIKISETNNPISAPAASLDRLEIKLDSKRSVIISPKLKHEFIEELKKINPKIMVVTKGNNS